MQQLPAAKRGKLVAGILLVVGVGAAAFAWRFHATQNRRILAYLTPQVAERVAHAPRVEAWEVAGPPAQFTTVKGRDVSTSPGISNIRYALVQDSTFEWETVPRTAHLECKYGLSFGDGDVRPEILFDAGARHMVVPPEGRWLTLDARSSREIKAFFEEQLRGSE